MTKGLKQDLRRYANARHRGDLAAACIAKLHLFPKWLIRDLKRAVNLWGTSLGQLLVWFLGALK